MTEPSHLSEPPERETDAPQEASRHPAHHPRFRPGEVWRAARSGRDAFVDRVVGWRHDSLAGVSGPGAVVAMTAYVGANTPSLLPRPWYLQGVVAGICAVLGYGIGVAVGWLGHLLARWAGLRVSVKPSARRTLIALWLLVLALGVLAFPAASIGWQQYTSRYVGFEAPGVGYLVGSLVVATATCTVPVGLWRLVAGLVDWMTIRLENRILRESLARSIATTVTLVLVVFFVDQVVLRGGLVLAGRRADRVNAAQPEGRQAPTSPLRSGGPGSSESWASLGQDGAIFVSGGPTASDIAHATGRPAKEPIRVFAGVEGGRSMEQCRDAVLAEMDRTGAFGRAAVYVVTSTSTGFINEWSTSAFEYLSAGDTAVVSMQYSTLPSAIALLTARDDPPRAGRLLFEAVAARVAAMPARRRPRLYVGGESLGAYGGNGAFSSPEDMLRQVDGALWTGTPSFTSNHAILTGRRALGATEVNPVVDDGRNVRFASRPSELDADQYGHTLGAWRFPRVVYLQHESDPVAWWSPSLLFTTPDWLHETRVNNPMAQMSWYPLVTFWQVTADIAVSNTVPGGFGHRYDEKETVPAWAAVLGRDPGEDHRRISSQIAASTR